MNPFRDHFPSMAFGRVPETEGREEGVYSWIFSEVHQVGPLRLREHSQVHFSFHLSVVNFNYHMTRTAPLAFSLQNHCWKSRTRAVRGPYAMA